MSHKSVKKLTAGLICTTQRVYAALPPRCAVRLRLTGERPPKFLGGYASILSRTGKALALAAIITLVVFQFEPSTALAKKRVPPGGRVAVVVDERLAALRAAPDLRAKLLERLGRAHLVSIRGEKVNAEGLKFYRVAVSRKVLGWLQSDAVVVPWHPGDDRRLLTLINNSDEFDRIVRAKTFLDAFPRSPLVPQVLAFYAKEAEAAADKMSRDSQKRFTKSELPANGAPEYSYYLNYNGLDRYNREGITFLFDRATKKFTYDGAAWREILRRYPNSPEAAEARNHLETLADKTPK